jgi:hypothetical protein
MQPKKVENEMEMKETHMTDENNKCHGKKLGGISILKHSTRQKRGKRKRRRETRKEGEIH